MKNKGKPFLTITIATPTEDPEPGVSICWEDSPENVAGQEWDDEDQVWTKICNGIHALLAELGPVPEGGWDVKFTCPAPELVVEPNLTLEAYRNRGNEDSNV